MCRPPPGDRGVTNTLTAQVTSLAEIVQSLQAPLSNHVHSKESPTIMDSQVRTEIKRLKQAMKSLNELKNSFVENSFDDLPRISLPPNCSLDFRKYNETTDSLHHIKTFKIKIRPYTEDRQVLASLPKIFRRRCPKMVLYSLHRGHARFLQN